MSSFRDAIIEEARSWIGTPYLHQAALKSVGCDCIGLVRGVWRAMIGEEPETLPAYSPDWAEVDGFETLLEAGSRHFQTVADNKFQPGDVLIFRWRPRLPAKHCGIMVSSQTMVHAYQSAGLVCESPVAHWVPQKLVAAFAFPEPEGVS
jgi:NlpC/P60 family putative phage cell wall peptidase